MIERADRRGAGGPGRRTVALCLLALVATFASLVPGGPIENRDFSGLSPAVFWGFNAFLIGLGLTVLAAAGLAWRGSRPVLTTAIGVTWLYVFVFILDWAGIFPPSPEPMGFWLGAVEIFDAIMCFYVIFFAHRALARIFHEDRQKVRLIAWQLKRLWLF